MTAENADIKFECSQCGQPLAVESSAAGLKANCPICEHPITVPPASVKRFGGELSRTNEATAVLANPAVHPASPASGRAPYAEPNAGEMREELLDSAMENGQLEGDLHAAKEKIVRLQAHLRKALDECERLTANSLHAQAENKSFQADRQQLKTDLAQSRQRIAVWEAQAAENRGKMAEMSSELATANSENAALRQELEQRVSEHHDYQTSMERHVASREEELSSTTARTAEVIQALARAEEEVVALQKTEEKLRGELQTAHAQLQNAAGVRSQLAAVEENLRLETERARSGEAQCASLQSACDGFNKEIEDLRRDLEDTTAGRELLELRGRFNALEKEHHGATAALAEREAKIKTLSDSGDQLSVELKRTRSLYADAERRAEEVSEGKLIKDNDVLRGIIERQNVVLNESGRELRTLRRGRFALRLAYVFFGTVLLILVIFALSILNPHLLGR